MKQRKRATKYLGSIFTIFLLLSVIAGVIAARAFSSPASPEPTPSPAPTTESAQEKLTRELLLYYQTQNKRGDSSPTNWTGIVGVTGAVIAAIVALLSLYVNNRTAIRNQKDAQFYEALKRFGDKDSPTVRASAAGTIALLGQERVSTWTWQPDRRLPRRVKLLVYYETAVNQLITGLMLEENPVTLTAITDAAQKLVQIDPQLVLKSVHRANLKLQRDTVDALAEFFAALGLKESWLTISKINQAALVAGYEQEVMLQLFFRFSTQFNSSFEIAVQVLSFSDLKGSGKAKSSADQESEEGDSSSQTSLTTRKESPESHGFSGIIGRLISPKTAPRQTETVTENAAIDKNAMEQLNAFKEARRKLSVASGRLRANVEVYSAVLRSDPFKALHVELGNDVSKWDMNKLQSMDLENVFLVEADLRNAKLDGVNLERAQLQLTNLNSAELRGAKFRGAQLQGTTLIAANLEQAEMIAAVLRPFEYKKFEGGTWNERQTDLSLASLQQADLRHASLQGAALDYSNLQGAKLSNSRLVGTKLYKATIDDETNLDGANWWTANFFDTPREHIYVGPLKIWFQKYKDKVPESLDDIHPSVREFVQKQRQPQQEQNQEPSN